MKIKLFAAALSLFATNAFAGNLTLEMDKSIPIVLKRAATGVVVGNASIADVIVHDPKTVIVIGKSVGKTHVLILGENGRTLYSGNINVLAGDVGNMLTVQRGTEIGTKICADRCIDIVSPEDTAAFSSEAMGKIKNHTTMAKGN